MTVSAANPVVNTTTASVSGLVGEEEIKDLPLNGRSFDDLITLNPGAINYVLKAPKPAPATGTRFPWMDGPGEKRVLMNGIEYTGPANWP